MKRIDRQIARWDWIVVKYRVKAQFWVSGEELGGQAPIQEKVD